MGSGNSRDLTIDREDYSEKIPTYVKKQTHESSGFHSSTDSGFDQSFEPAKTDFVSNLSSVAGELITEAELKELKDIYDQKICRLQDENAQMHGATVEHLSETVQRVENKFIKASKKTICGDLQDEMIACFKKNKGETLKCMKNVDQFNNCMQQYRSKDGMQLIHHQIATSNVNNTNKNVR